MNPIEGKNVVAAATSEQYKSMADVEAALKAHAAQPAPVDPSPEAPPTPVAPEPMPNPVTPPEPEVLPEGKKIEVPQQFRDREGKPDEELIQKSSEHWEKVKTKKKDALEAYRKLQETQREASQIGQELKQVKEQARPVLNQLIDQQDFSPEVRQRIQEDIEKDAVGTILRLHAEAKKHAEAIAQRRWEMEQAEKRQEQMLRRLDELASNGNEWLLTPEGHNLMEGKLKEDPDLWRTRDPYGYALASLQRDGLIPTARQAGQAQSAPGTPILGASHAVPPPSSAPPVSKDQMLQKLRDQFMVAVQQGDKAQMNKIMQKMDVLGKSI